MQIRLRPFGVAFSYCLLHTPTRTLGRPHEGICWLCIYSIHPCDRLLHSIASGKYVQSWQHWFFLLNHCVCMCVCVCFNCQDNKDDTLFRCLLTICSHYWNTFTQTVINSRKNQHSSMLSHYTPLRQFQHVLASILHVSGTVQKRWTPFFQKIFLLLGFWQWW